MITLDPREGRYAIQQGVIKAVDIHVVFTPLTLEYVLERARPDQVLHATSTTDLGLAVCTEIRHASRGLCAGRWPNSQHKLTRARSTADDVRDEGCC